LPIIDLIVMTPSVVGCFFTDNKTALARWDKVNLSCGITPVYLTYELSTPT
jgi:hypothetical protein